MHGLVSPDDAVRRRALARHSELVEKWHASMRLMNQHWQQAGYSSHFPWQARRADRKRVRYENQSIFGLLHVPEFTALYLRWEVDFPHEWREDAHNLWSPWSHKERVLWRFGREGVPAEIRSQVTDLVFAVLRREYRCKDWLYARVARRVADAEFLSRLEELRSSQPLRTEFIRHLLSDQRIPITRNTWSRWLASTIDCGGRL